MKASDFRTVGSNSVVHQVGATLGLTHRFYDKIDKAGEYRERIRGLAGDTPCGRNKEPPDDGPVRSIPVVGGLHHRYTRQAA